MNHKAPVRRTPIMNPPKAIPRTAESPNLKHWSGTHHTSSHVSNTQSTHLKCVFSQLNDKSIRLSIKSLFETIKTLKCRLKMIKTIKTVVIELKAEHKNVFFLFVCLSWANTVGKRWTGASNRKDVSRSRIPSGAAGTHSEASAVTSGHQTWCETLFTVSVRRCKSLRHCFSSISNG